MPSLHNSGMIWQRNEREYVSQIFAVLVATLFTYAMSHMQLQLGGTACIVLILFALILAMATSHAIMHLHAHVHIHIISC